jgi:hypothetical protein
MDLKSFVAPDIKVSVEDLKSASSFKIEKVALNEKGQVVQSTGNRIRRSKEQEGNGHWEFPENLGGKEYFGFVYAIFDPKTKRGYIGKKQFFGTGKLNKGQDSNWRRYTSSCKELNEEIRLRGIQNFSFIVLEQYKIRGTLGWAEVWSQCIAETPTSNVWYNGLIEKVSWTVKEAITDRHKERLSQIINMVNK